MNLPAGPNKHRRYTVMPIDHSTRLPLSTWDSETLRAVAVAYRRVRGLGERDLRARTAAEAVYLERYPMATEVDTQVTVAAIISAVARDHPQWFWSGVGAVTP
jgi:hypothetical protein